MLINKRRSRFKIVRFREIFSGAVDFFGGRQQAFSGIVSIQWPWKQSEEKDAAGGNFSSARVTEVVIFHEVWKVSTERSTKRLTATIKVKVVEKKKKKQLKVRAHLSSCSGVTVHSMQLLHLRCWTSLPISGDIFPSVDSSKVSKDPQILLGGGGEIPQYWGNWEVVAAAVWLKLSTREEENWMTQ